MVLKNFIIISSFFLSALSLGAPKTIMILDWDDTLFPTKATSRLIEHAQDVQRKSVPERTLEDCLHEYVKMAPTGVDWEGLDEEASRLLNFYCEKYDVYLVTAASLSWLEMTASFFMPKTDEILKSLAFRDHVFSTYAEDVFGNRSMDSLRYGKYPYFFHLTHGWMGCPYQTVIAIGDGPDEYQSMKQLRRDLPPTVALMMIRMPLGREDGGDLIRRQLLALYEGWPRVENYLSPCQGFRVCESVIEGQWDPSHDFFDLVDHNETSLHQRH